MGMLIFLTAKKCIHIQPTGGSSIELFFFNFLFVVVMIFVLFNFVCVVTCK